MISHEDLYTLLDTSMNSKSLIFFYRLISLTITLGCGATTFYFYCLQLPEHKGQVQNFPYQPF